jgi:hypothetical protein
LVKESLGCRIDFGLRKPFLKMSIVMPPDHKHQGHQQEQSKGKRDQILSPIFVFSVLILPRLLAAQYSIIGDCDEGVPPYALRVNRV